ncbi:MAG: T9SS type A sorting domain-containing protein [Bacteroidetes bacterium]|nr:MAG: T9SS type A sorting domain-containing protein [Bacteroidota bacterium]
MRSFLLSMLTLTSLLAEAQSFAPEPGQEGSIAIHKDSSVFVGWANSIELYRGYADIAVPDSGMVDFGVAENALGPAEGNTIDVVSLGDSGYAVLQFLSPIYDGPGPDFAVFENGFADHYLELAFVEVSTDGIHFQRFPATSEIPLDHQMGPFEYSNCAYVHNLAGKYRQGYGTPFDLAELPDSDSVDRQQINYIRIVDVIGSLDSVYASKDQHGNIINDPYPTLFPSGGFDLDAIGVIHQKSAGLKEIHLKQSIWPNPFQDLVHLDFPSGTSYQIYTLTGKLVHQGVIRTEKVLGLNFLLPGSYLFQVTWPSGRTESLHLTKKSH